jgi:hypothetical protein
VPEEGRQEEAKPQEGEATPMSIFPTCDRFRAWLLGVGVALLSVLALHPAHAAAALPEELLQIPRSGLATPSSETGRLRGPRSIAADRVSGHVFVAEGDNFRISEFTSWGEFVKSWGWGVVASGPGNEPRNEKQQVTVAATGGTFTLKFLESPETAAIPFDASAATLEAALEGLASVGEGGVAVSGEDGGPWTVEFVGSLADLDVPVLQPVATGLTGGAASAEVDVVQPGASFEVCVAAAGDTCKLGQIGAVEPVAPGQFGTVGGVAIDSAGNVYVHEPSNRVQKFSPDGEFLLMFGGGVNKTTGADICTKADLEAGDVCGSGLSGSGPAELSNDSHGSYITIGPDDTVYVGDVGRIQEFGPDGTYKGEIKLSGQLEGKVVKALASDQAGDLYLAVAPPGDSEFKHEGVFKVDVSGQLLAPTFPVTDPHDIAVDSAGNVYVVTRPDQSSGGRVVEFDASGEVLISSEELFAAELKPSAYGMHVATNVLGDGSSAPGDVYVANAYGQVNGDTLSVVKVYGPIPQFEPASPAPPTISRQYATAVSPTGATVGGEINPHFFADTAYYVEYGIGKCSEGGCSNTAPTPLGSERDAPASTSPIELTGLAPNTIYHYRIVAVAGPFTTKGLGEGEAGDEATFTTGVAHPRQLPDGRVYEMVSPPQKNNGDVALSAPAQSVAPLQASPAGDAITYSSFAAFGEAPQGSPSANQYISRRIPTGGWSTQNITPPDEESYLTDPLRGFSQDLSRAAVITLEPPLLPEAAVGFTNLYVMDTASEAMELATPGIPEIAVERKDYCVEFTGASADFSRVIFLASGALLEENPLSSFSNAGNLYEWSAADGVRLVSILPNNKPAQPKTIRGFGMGNGCGVRPRNFLAGAISADGSKIFWSAGGKLYARVNGKETFQLDLKQGGSGSGGGVFSRASSDGSTVFFISSNALTPGAAEGSKGDLYRYDFEAPVGSRLQNVSSGGGIGGVLGASAAGDSIYFASQAVLANNEGPSGGVADPGSYNIYLWQQGEGVRFVASLSKEHAPGTSDAIDSSNFVVDREAHTARVTPGGDLAFVSLGALTGYDNTDSATSKTASEVYFYDASADELRCASCNPSGARPIGASTVPTWVTPIDQPRYLSDDGRRVFFESGDALDEHDTNGAVDVYEFELAGSGDCSPQSPTYAADRGGCINLISSGSYKGGAGFVDASTTGDDIFIITRERLVPRDEDDNRDIYDVRVGGGEPPLPVPPVPCEGEACRGVATPSNPPALPASATFQGAANPKPKAVRCKKPRRKVKRGGKVRCVKPVHSRRHHKHRQSSK